MLRTSLLLAACLLTTTAGTASAQPTDSPVIEENFGVRTVDDDRWMESPANADRLRAWVLAQSDKAHAGLKALPERQWFADKLKEVSSGLTRVGGYQTAAGVEVYRKAVPGDRTPKIFVREGGQERMFFDPDPGADKPVRTVSNYSLSPNGKYLTLHVTEAGAEIGSFRVFDVATGKPIGVKFDRIWGEGAMEWFGNDVVSYRQMAPKGKYTDPLQGMVVYIRPLNGKGAGKAILGPGLAEGFEPKEFPIVEPGIDSAWTLGIGGGARADQNWWVAPTAAVKAGNPGWKTAFRTSDKVINATILGDRLYVLSNKGSSAGTLLSHPILPGGALGPATTIAIGNDRLILTSLISDRRDLYLVASSDSVARLFRLPGGSGEREEIALPFETGEIFALNRDARGNGINFGASGWLTNAVSFAVRDGKLYAPPGLTATTWAGAADFVSERLSARSADGTDVPLVIVRQKGPLPAGGRPTLLEAYGGYGISTATPYYNRNAMAFVARGGVIAYCGVRGGGERGRDWHEGGRGSNKPNGHADFIACAQKLTAAGIAPSRGPVGTGTSMGGALAPPAALKAPHAFSGLVPKVGILNATRIGAAPNGENQFDEMGDPRTAEGYRALNAMDAYQMLLTATDTPDTLVIIGLNDNRVAPWMSAKYAARAQRRFPSRTVWLRADKEAGHGIGTAEDVARAQWADIYAFAWDRGGAGPPAPAVKGERGR